MNCNQAIQKSGWIGGFAARHIFAVMGTVGVACVLWTITYFSLLLWAAFAGAGIGSPASYPIGLFVILVAGTAVSFTIYFPCTSLAEWIARRHGLPILAQIPISVAFLIIQCLVVTGTATAVSRDYSFREVSVGFGVLVVAQLAPLGLYWWVAQSGPILLSVFRRVRSISRRHFGSQSPK
ncbi:MAG: hypothetical protein JSS02_17295 [Planctomycetes bacterium]|nr:hypothetical protein [Planctomycetota bacterium]